MTLHSKPLSIIIVLTLFGGIMLSNYLGWWLTESTKEVAAIAEGEFAGLPNPEDIRGSYTFGDLENNFGIPAALLAEAFVIESDDPQAFQIKNLENQYGESEFEIGTASVRMFVAFYSGLPLDLGMEESYLPKEAVSLLQKMQLTDEQADYLKNHTIDVSTGIDQNPSEPETEVEINDGTEKTVKGKTTFAEVLSWGVFPQTIEDILGMPMPEENLTVIKDFIVENGLVFETIKTDLQIAIDSLN